MDNDRPLNVNTQGGDVVQGDKVAGDKIGRDKIVNVLPPTPPPPYTPPALPAPGELPAPGRLPPGSHLPYERNQAFTGRQAELLRLAEMLLEGGQVVGVPPQAVGILPAPAAATGPGGIGKSQLAVEFCYRWGRYFYGVHWVNAAQPEAIAAEIAACGAAMRLPGWPEKQPEQVALTLHAWQEQPLRLVVLDNLEEPQALRAWLPHLECARLLVTSRQERWPGGLLHALGVETLPRPESLALLRALAPHLKAAPDAALDALAERLGDLPLALDLAGRYLDDRPGLSAGDYLKELEAAGGALAHPSQQDWSEHSPTRHLTSLHATFQLSWQRLAPALTPGPAPRRGEGSAGELAARASKPPMSKMPWRRSSSAWRAGAPPTRPSRRGCCGKRRLRDLTPSAPPSLQGRGKGG